MNVLLFGCAHFIYTYLVVCSCLYVPDCVCLVFVEVSSKICGFLQLSIYYNASIVWQLLDLQCSAIGE